MKEKLPPIGSAIYNVTCCKVVKGIITKYTTEDNDKYMHGVDTDGTTWDRNVAALGKGMFIKRSEAVEYLKTKY